MPKRLLSELILDDEPRTIEFDDRIPSKTTVFVMTMLWDGCSRKEIAARLVSENLDVMIEY